MQAAARIQPVVISETTAEPSVTYLIDVLTINVTVIATPAEEPGKFKVVTAPILVPHGKWTICWELLSQSAPAEFSSIDLSQDQLGCVTVANLGRDGDDWRYEVDNNIGPVSAFNGFNYFINLVPKGQEGPITPHDPAIALTSDPIGG